MKKILGLCCVLCIVIGVAPYARGIGRPAAPPGVTANDWVPLGDAAGFVITRETPLPGSMQREPATVMGYFMVRRAAGWRRVDAMPDYNVQKALLPP
jgi:hypothetical protein